MTLPRPQEIEGLAEAAVAACLPILPLEGSDNRGYKVSPRIHTVTAATPEEWVDAAMAIANLHAALRDFPSVMDASGGAFTVDVQDDRDKVPLWVPVIIGIALAAVIIIAGVKL